VRPRPKKNQTTHFFKVHAEKKRNRGRSIAGKTISIKTQEEREEGIPSIKMWWRWPVRFHRGKEQKVSGFWCFGPEEGKKKAGRVVRNRINKLEGRVEGWSSHSKDRQAMA